MRNLVNFNASIGKSENLPFDVLLLPKVCTEELCREKRLKEFGEQVVESTFWKKIAHRISSFWTLHCLSEVV